MTPIPVPEPRKMVRIDDAGAGVAQTRLLHHARPNTPDPLLRPASCPHVSVLIATYNRAEWLRRALESVAAQTYRDFEVIVIDDGSTDQTRQVVESFSGRVPSLRYARQINGGQAKALNAGIRLARGVSGVPR